MSGRHDPVLVRETLAYLRNGPGLYLDATLGDGGHAEALLDAEPSARLLGCDRDLEALAYARGRLARFGERVTLVHATFREIPACAAGAEPLAGALLDLGLSSHQIDEPSRGMSFMADGPLDLRMDQSRGAPAAERLATADVVEVEEVLRDHGDVRPAGRLARAIVAAARDGRLATTRALAELVAQSVGGRAHPRLLAQVFQALRIWINDEAAELDAVLEWLPHALRPGAPVVALSYQSGEDRSIKRAMRGVRGSFPSRRRPPREDERLPEGPWEVLTPRIVTPSPEEQLRNPRSRSARLRAFRRKST